MDRSMLKVISGLALAFTSVGFLFALLAGSYVIALFQLGLFAFNVYHATTNKIFSR